MKFFAFFLIPALVACQGVSPSSLTPVEKETVLRISQDVRWKLDGAFGSGRTEWLLVSGKYKAKLSDGAGVYYIGESPCFYSTIVVESKAKSGLSFGCGIFVPNDPATDPKVFLVEGTSRTQTRFHSDGTPVRDASAQGHAVPSLYSAVPGGFIGAAITQGSIGNFIDPARQPPPGWLQR